MNYLARNLSTILLLLITQVNNFAQIQVGDTLDFWSVSYIDWQAGSIPQRLITATCNRVGDSCYFFIDTSATAIPPQQQIDDLVEAFDTDYAQNLTPIYGPIPDEFDNDRRIFILLVEPEGWTGYFDPAQQMADSFVFGKWGKHSSEREIIYISTDAFLYNVALFTLAHEFGHMLHWAQDHSPEPPVDPVKYWEDEWIDEAFAMFAGVYLMEDLTVPGVVDYNAFFATNPDLPLIYCISNYSYNQVKLWLTFMYEHYGGLDFISTLIQDQANGIPGVGNTLGNLGYPETFEESFQHWVLANYLDDEAYQNGRYSYHHYNFPPCYVTAIHVNYPTELRTDSVSAYAADYVVFRTTSPKHIAINFSGDSTSLFRLSFILTDFQTNEVIAIHNIPLDSINGAIFSADSFGIVYDKITMVVMNVDSSLAEDASAQYSYIANVTTGIAEDQEDVFEEHSLFSYLLTQNYPNPFNPSTTIEYTLPHSAYVHLTIYNTAGQEVRILIDNYQKAGKQQVTWDGKDKFEKAAASGVYMYRLKADDFVQTRKMLLLR